MNLEATAPVPTISGQVTLRLFGSKPPEVIELTVFHVLPAAACGMWQKAGKTVFATAAPPAQKGTRNTPHVIELLPPPIIIVPEHGR